MNVHQPERLELGKSTGGKPAAIAKDQLPRRCILRNREWCVDVSHAAIEQELLGLARVGRYCSSLHGARRSPDVLVGAWAASFASNVELVPAQRADGACAQRSELGFADARRSRMRIRIELREPAATKLRPHTHTVQSGLALRQMKIDH